MWSNSQYAQRNFSVGIRLIMDVTIGHVFDTHPNFKPNTLLSLSYSKNLKYAEHYQRQRLAFAPIVANTLGQFGADTLQFLWNLADHEAKSTFGFTIDSPVTNNLSQTSPPSTYTTRNRLQTPSRPQMPRKPSSTLDSKASQLEKLDRHSI